MLDRFQVWLMSPRGHGFMAGLCILFGIINGVFAYENIFLKGGWWTLLGTFQAILVGVMAYLAWDTYQRLDDAEEVYNVAQYQQEHPDVFDELNDAFLTLKKNPEDIEALETLIEHGKAPQSPLDLSADFLATLEQQLEIVKAEQNDETTIIDWTMDELENTS